MSEKFFIRILVVVTIACLLHACSGKNNAGESAAETEVLPEDIVEMRDDQIQLADIITGPIEMRSLSATIRVNGEVTVAPQNLASICAPMGGFIRNIYVMPGAEVKKGQMLAIIENQEFVDIQQNYLETKNQFEYAEIEYKRHSELYESDVYSRNNMEQVTADYKSLKAKLSAMVQKLALIGIDPANLRENQISRTVNVVSPITGSVGVVNVNLGKYFTPAEVLFEVVNTDQLLLDLTLFEKDVDKVTMGQKLRFFINNETEQHEAVVYQTGKSVSSDRTFKAYAKVINKCKNVIPGMYVHAIIETSGGGEVASLPSEAVVSFDDKDYIFVYTKDKQEAGKPFTEYRMVEVKKGVTENGFTEIAVPDSINLHTAKVVIKGAYNLLSAKKNAGEMAC
jgi:membrane fusion protein, heavy metal efflux system